MTTVAAWGAQDAKAKMVPLNIDRRDPQPKDVDIEIMYCGVCHSDLHIARNDWGGTNYPLVPGHEIVGRVKAVGNSVDKHKVGDIVAVGCLVGSCGTCGSCADGVEQYCEGGGLIGTYNSPDPKHGNAITYGGYSKRIVVCLLYTSPSPRDFG